MPRLLGLISLLLVGLLGAALLGWQTLRARPLELAPVLRLRPRAPTPGLRPVSRPLGEAEAALLRYRVVRAATPPLSATTNILLAGIDTRPSHFGGRTDALLVLVLDRRTRHLGVISIPRDLLVDVPGHDRIRINTVFLRGSRESSPAGGARLLRETVHSVLGLPIHHHVFIDHAGFEQLIDLLGGVVVDVQCPLEDRFIDPRGEGGRLVLRLAAGMQRLDGQRALLFARSRHGRGVIDRNRRQQAVLLGLRDRLRDVGVSGIASLLPLLRKTVYTDLRAITLLRLLRRLLRVRREHLHGLLLRAKHAPARVLPDGRWVMLADQVAIDADLRQLFSQPAPGARKRRCPPMDVALRRPAKRRAAKRRIDRGGRAARPSPTSKRSPARPGRL